MAAALSRAAHPSFGVQPVTDLRTKWANFSDNLRDRGVSLDSARSRVLDFGRKLRRDYFEARKVFVRDDTDTRTGDAG